MFCPKCGAEYRQGFWTCNDCNVALVHELPLKRRPENRGAADGAEHVEYEEILETYSPTDIAFIKSILDAEDITYFFKGEIIGSIQPMADRAKLMVSKDQAKEVKNLLADMKISFIGSGSGQEETETEDNKE
jgi:hypothetical protein